MGSEASPEVRRQHVTEAYGPKIVEKTQKAQDKAMALAYPDDPDKFHHHNKGPAGGFDDTPIPRMPPGYTVKFTFHRANNLPVSDFNTLSSDPFIRAELRVALPKRHKQDPELAFRTPTIRRDVNPVWDAEWIVANVPATGFHLKCRVYDEDPADHDDRLGNAHIAVDSISKDWAGIKEGSYHIKKRSGSKRAYFFRTISASLSAHRSLNAELVVSVEVLGPTPTDNGGHMYTQGPMYWFKHSSPLIGRLLKTSAASESQDAEGKTTPYK
jgi:hypothetical protein